MPVKVYLKDAENVPKFGAKTKSDGSIAYRIGTTPEIPLHVNCGRFYIELDSLDTSIPEILKNLVEEVHYVEILHPDSPRRELGIYGDPEKAQADLQEVEIAPDKSRIRLRIRARSMENLREIYRRVKTGTIRPEHSYEAKQGGVSRSELENQLRLGKEDLAKLQGMYHWSLANLNKFRESLRRNPWPLCSTSEIRGKLSEILWNINEHTVVDEGEKPQEKEWGRKSDKSSGDAGAEKILSAMLDGIEKMKNEDEEELQSLIIRNMTPNKRPSLTDALQTRLAGIKIKWLDWRQSRRGIKIKPGRKNKKKEAKKN